MATFDQMHRRLAAGSDVVDTNAGNFRAFHAIVDQHHRHLAAEREYQLRVVQTGGDQAIDLAQRRR